MTFIDRTGEIFNNLQIISDLGNKKVIARCLLCNSEKEYRKATITSNRQKSCGCLNSCFIDRTGATFNGIKVIQELGNSKISGQCIHCGDIKDYNKDSVTQNKRRSCGCLAPKIINRLGEIHRDLRIIEELGGRKVRCQCIKCGYIDTYTKGEIVKNNKSCNNCGKAIVITRNTVGSVFRDLRVDKELGKGKVICTCLKCSEQGEYNKEKLTQLKAICKKCGIKGTTLIDRTGQTFGDLQITEELYKDKIKCKCIKCGHMDIYTKGAVVNLRTAECKNCGLKTKYYGKQVSDVIIHNLAYRGRDGNKYYNCTCNKCREKILLTREEILNYICAKEG